MPHWLELFSTTPSSPRLSEPPSQLPSAAPGHLGRLAVRVGKCASGARGGRTLHLIWQAHADTVYTLAFSPDERMLATGSWDGTIKLWDVQSGTLLWTGQHANAVRSVAFAPDGHLLASGGDDAVVRLWEVASGKMVETLHHPGHVFSTVWNPDGQLLASGSSDGHVRVWQVQDNQPATCTDKRSPVIPVG